MIKKQSQLNTVKLSIGLNSLFQISSDQISFPIVLEDGWFVGLGWVGWVGLCGLGWVGWVGLGWVGMVGWVGLGGLGWVRWVELGGLS